jgi:oligoendopeptidase F
LTTARHAPQREEISPEFQWKLTDLFPDDGSWDAAAEKLVALFPKLTAFQGKLSEGPEVLKNCMEVLEEVHLLAERLYVYALMQSDQDTRQGKAQARKGRATSLSAQTAAAMAFFEPELLSLGQEKLAQYMEAEPSLGVYNHFFQEILRMAPHTLSPREEEILALSTEMAAAPGNIHSALSNADLKFPTIRDEAGEEVRLTSGNFIEFMHSSNRQVRKDAFTALYSAYMDHKHSFATLLDSSLRKDLFYARLRKYPQTLHSALFPDNIPQEVYHNLLTAVHEYLPAMHRYQGLRKKLLGLEEVHSYDLYAPLFDTKMKIPYQKAQEILLKALAPLGEEYIGVLREAFSSGWIDVYENQGKRSGAYAWGAYGTHPYVLLNYKESLEGIYTLAHELGHAMHSYHSNRSQPYIYADYTIFLAEIASTVNEVLLTGYLLNTLEGERRLVVLNYYLEQFRTTLFRQTMFAEFELKIHSQVAEGKTLTMESLNEVYRQLNEKYYGPNVHTDPQLDFEWARIPHFYTAFYVYKYATGFSSAVALARAIEEEGAERYLKFLSSGSRDYSLNILKEAGVDLTDGEPFLGALANFTETVEKLAEYGGE